MDIIRNYLENMFANLPNSAEVRRAKKELGQMMEDKYNELVAEGKSENEAVGTVISEFGNLDELAEELGLEEEVEQEKATLSESPRRLVSMDEAKDYLHDQAKAAFGIAVGVALCIMSVGWPILTFEISFIPDVIGAVLMMAMIAVAVIFFIVSANIINRWDYLKKELCSIDYATAGYVKSEKERFHASYVVHLAVGVVLCATCWIPLALFDSIGSGHWPLGSFVETIGLIFLFVICAVGVFLLVHGGMIDGSFDDLLKLNDRNTVVGSFARSGEKEYAGPVADGFMSIYWPTVRCFYLIWSFLTFAWYKTWIIWPIAAVINAILNGVFSKRDEELS
ncbi:MAG: permease prefix domain 1-containing protein [Lachnospiraceae bacterium]|nr:permease prefix domain 1-containing protein [Lachnospiraceae bacterium]